MYIYISLDVFMYACVHICIDYIYTVYTVYKCVTHF